MLAAAGSEPARAMLSQLAVAMHRRDMPDSSR